MLHIHILFILHQHHASLSIDSVVKQAFPLVLFSISCNISLHFHYVFSCSKLSLGYGAKIFVPTAQCEFPACLPMGLHTVDYPAQGVYVVPTNAKEPYCSKFCFCSYEQYCRSGRHGECYPTGIESPTDRPVVSHCTNWAIHVARYTV